jgi:hypothetical protein
VPGVELGRPEPAFDLYERALKVARTVFGRAVAVMANLSRVVSQVRTVARKRTPK